MSQCFVSVFPPLISLLLFLRLPHSISVIGTAIPLFLGFLNAYFSYSAHTYGGAAVQVLFESKIWN